MVEYVPLCTYFSMKVHIPRAYCIWWDVFLGALTLVCRSITCDGMCSSVHLLHIPLCLLHVEGCVPPSGLKGLKPGLRRELFLCALILVCGFTSPVSVTCGGMCSSVHLF